VYVDLIRWWCYTRSNSATTQAGGIHDNYINISSATYTQTPMPLSK
jgi:hypothetical protein